MDNTQINQENEIAINEEERLNLNQNQNLMHRSCDGHIVKLLRHLISGVNGELTLLAQLTFQHFLTSDNDKKLDALINEIIKNKYKVLNEFSLKVLEFGGIPKFVNGQGMYWGAKSVDYQLSPDRFVQNNIRLLERQIREYNKAINQINDEPLITLLNDQIENNNRLIALIKSNLN